MYRRYRKHAMLPYFLELGLGGYFLPASFDPVLKRSWRLNGAGIYILIIHVLYFPHVRVFPASCLRFDLPCFSILKLYPTWYFPTHVRRGLIRCLYNKARIITTSPDSLQREEDHLASVLKFNGYPSTFICASSTPPTQPAEDARREQPQGRDRPPLMVLPYMSGVSEDSRNVC